MMTRIALFCLLVFTSLSGIAQVMVEDTDINQLDIRYCELVAKEKFLGSKITIFVDYGQEKPDSEKIKDNRGKNKKFNSVVQVLNFMDKNGWEYVNHIAISIEKDKEYRYLLRRKE